VFESPRARQAKTPGRSSVGHVCGRRTLATAMSWERFPGAILHQNHGHRGRSEASVMGSLSSECESTF